MQFKLISVDFKEAALDSPTFRASVNYLDAQVNNIEKWLQANFQFLERFPPYEKDLRIFTYSFLENLRPTLLQEGLLEQEYTVVALQSVVGGLQRLWETAINILTVSSSSFNLLSNLLVTDIPHYKSVRAKFDELQLKYDNYLNMYTSLPKTKDASIVMDDAHQMYEVKKEYTSISIELANELNNLGARLDKEFIKFSKELWFNKNNLFQELNLKAQMYNANLKKLERLESWSELRYKSQMRLNEDIEAARNQVEAQAFISYMPSSNLDDYRIQLINDKTLHDINEPSIEKHGYLFMKTYRNNSSKPIWVRRWAYLKGGVFGLLCLNPSNNSVQETDKLGLMVCNFKYAVNEDRRYCFEVKTVDSSFIFQCDSLIELKSWLKVYANGRSHVLECGDEYALSLASARYPPIVKELSDALNTSTDKQLTSTKIMSKDGHVIASSKLGTHIESHQKDFKKYVYNEILQIKPPFVTDSTKSAILSYSLVCPTNLPTALTANIWGSINWGLYYLNQRDEDPNDLTKTIKNQEDHIPAASTGNKSSNHDDKRRKEFTSVNEHIPPMAPHLVPRDVQMRALFETAVESGEICLLSFNCTWIPNSKGELTGRTFITKDHLYAYFNEKGFISMFKGKVREMTAVEGTLGDGFDLMKLYMIRGTIKFKLFLEDAVAIKQKLEILIENQIKETSDDNDTIVTKFEAIDRQRTPLKFASRKISINKNQPVATSAPISTPIESGIKDVKDVKDVKELNDAKRNSLYLHGANGVESGIGSSLAYINPSNVKTADLIVDYSKTSNFLSSGDYHVPPKAVFHALLGDKSLLLQDLASVSTMSSIVKKPWNVGKDGKLYRKYNGLATYFARAEFPLQFQQHIDSMVDNEYYSFTHRKGPFKFSIGSQFFMEYRIVIIGLSSNKTRVKVYASPVFSEDLIVAKFIINIICKIIVQEARLLQVSLKQAEKSIGTHGPIPRAIYLYGKLSQSEFEDNVPDVPPAHFGLVSAGWLLFSKLVLSMFGLLASIFQTSYELGSFALKKFVLYKFLILILVISSLFNLFLIGLSTNDFWKHRQISKIADEFMSSSPNVVNRAVYIQDYIDLIEKNKFKQDLSNSTKCFDIFYNNSFSINHDRLTRWDIDYFDETTRTVAKGLKSSLFDIGIQRNELLVKLKLLNQMEYDIAEAEWRNWLLSESQRCDLAIQAGFAQDNQELIDYCQSCSFELANTNLL